MMLREPLSRAEQLLLDLCREIARLESEREDLLFPDHPDCGICNFGQRHVKLCPRHAAMAYCGGLE